MLVFFILAVGHTGDHGDVAHILFQKPVHILIQKFPGFNTGKLAGHGIFQGILQGIGRQLRVKGPYSHIKIRLFPVGVKNNKHGAVRGGEGVEHTGKLVGGKFILLINHFRDLKKPHIIREIVRFCLFIQPQRNNGKIVQALNIIL